jgi:hypothetical protein
MKQHDKEILMQQITLGARITDDGVEFFGTDEVNALIEQGHRVVTVYPGRTLVEAVPEEDDAYAVSGFEITVTLAEPETT